MELRQLTTFCRAAELGSFTKAAEAVHLSQAAVSQQIRALEAELGVRLFEREARRVELTAEGWELYQRARRLLELAQEALTAVAGQRPPPLSGEVRVGTSTVPGEHLLAPLLAAFRRRCPGIKILTTVANSSRTIELLQERQVQVGVIGAPPPRGWEAFPLATDRLALVQSSSHPVVQETAISLRQLAKFPFVMREPGSGTRKVLEKQLRSAGLPLRRLLIVVELGSTEAVLDAVRAGVGISAVSELAAHKELSSGELVELRISGLSLERTIYVVLAPRCPLPLPALAFVSFLRSGPVGHE